ncbi:TrkA family potassium uptake protein [Sinobaca sp. H24]|uniref:potassium channel family protein n=1 Tax=Sinobaca sp. H24 TaxID=2923376 RepID=UPI002079F779|nr:TrkA family potassium uptake protein [Sinobaca sp. H24]
MAKNKKQFAVIGLGRFGGSICRELYHLGYEVLAIDQDEEKVDEYVTYATQTACIDSTDEKALKSLGLGNFDHVVVAIGDHIQASVLTTLVLKDMNVPIVWAKAQNKYHQKVLDKIGADRVVHPEFDMGIRVAHNMTSEKVIDFIDLSNDYTIVEVYATKKLHRKTLIDSNVRATYGVTILAIKRNEDVNVSPRPNDQIEQGDMLIVLGHKDEIRRFENEGL